jgi:diguanylate cyclase (GGDEF)-like protein/PAS domain S-box-containing protein
MEAALGGSLSAAQELAAQESAAQESASGHFVGLTASIRGAKIDEFTQAIIESAPISMIATDLHGTILAMNSAAEQLTRYRKRDLVAQHSLVLLHDPVEMSQHAVKMAHELKEPVPAGFQSLTARCSRGTEDEYEWTYVQKGGTRVMVSQRVIQLRSSDGVSSGYLAMAFDITERKTLAESLAHMAHHDQLTGLPNRTLLDERLSHAMQRSDRFGRSVAIYMVNVDNFKRFNDSLGNAGGDTVIRYVADQLRTSVRQTDTVARVGGDEFVVVMPDFGEAADAERCAETMQRRIATPIMIGDREIRVTASIGFCLYPESAKDAPEILRTTNAAMREAKASGQVSLAANSHIKKAETSGRLELEEDLRYALERGEFSLHYQPQIDCMRGEVTGLEALLRWQNPKRGNVPPMNFIPLAEEIGLMVPISEWLFKKACEDCVDLEHQTGRSLKLAVNLSPRQFRQRKLASLVEKTLQSTGLSPHNLELEITEQMLMVNSGDTLTTLASIRKLGVGIAIDDFGTGFSSFSYILQYHADRIKIDQSFIANVLHDSNATAVVRAIIAMAHGLNIPVVAEGVETPEQFEFLLRRRCDVVQGYLFSRPVPKHEFAMAVDKVSAMRALHYGPTNSRAVRELRPVKPLRMEAATLNAGPTPFPKPLQAVPERELVGGRN